MRGVPVYIALGSNLADPLQQVRQAFGELAELPESHLLKVSQIYRTAPIGPPGQPDYINAAALLETQLSPLALLDALQAIEQAHQRVRLERWGPRTLDLDLLLYGNQKISLPRLQVPHPELANRSFVLYPLADLNPDLVLPDGSALQGHLASCPPQGLSVISGPTGAPDSPASE